MPNYEYRCLNCRRRFEVFMKFSDYGSRPVACPYCKSENVQRKIGRVRVARSDASRMENLSDPASLASLDEDPRALGRMMRQMQGELGEEMPAEFDEVVDRLEKGQDPEQIEKELPDLGSGMGGGEDFGADAGLMGGGLED